MAKIVTSEVLNDTRVGGKAGMVMAQHIFDDGQVWTATFEALAGEDAQTRLDDMIPQREIERAQNDLDAVEEEFQDQALDKLVAIPDSTLIAAGLTADEVAAVKEEVSK